MGFFLSRLSFSTSFITYNNANSLFAVLMSDWNEIPVLVSLPLKN